MGTHYSPRTVTDGLLLAFDVANPKSYPGSGTTITDLAKTGSATLEASATYSDQYAGSVQVAGTNHILVDGVPTGTSWTVQIWSGIINADPAFAVVGHRTYASTDNFRLQWDDKGTNNAHAPFADFVSPGGQLLGFANKSEADLFERWNLVTMTSDGVLSRMYFNEELSNNTSAARVFSTSGQMSVGVDLFSGIGGTDQFNRDGGECFFGPISIYNRALSADEVQQNYNALKGRFGL